MHNESELPLSPAKNAGEPGDSAAVWHDLELLGETFDQLAEQNRVANAAAAMKVRTIEKARQQVETMQARELAELRRTGGVKFQSDELARRSFRQQLGVALGIHEFTAGALANCADDLVNEFTTTLTTLESGLITLQHAQILTETAFGIPGEHRAEYETRCLRKAVILTPTRFKAEARRIRARLHPEELEERHQKAFEDRTIYLEPAHDGMARYTVENSAVSIFALDDRVNRIANFLKEIEGETRTLAQLRSDTATRLLLDGDIYTEDPDTVAESGATSDARADAPADGTTSNDRSTALSAFAAPSTFNAPRAPRRGRFARFTPTVNITVPVLSLLGKSEEPATLDGYGPIPLSQAAELAAGAPSFTRILTHPETGAVLSVGRDSYRVPKDLARWIQTRDGTCRQYACGKPARRTELDHTTPWTPARWRPEGGTTSADNLACLCKGCHTTKHALLINGWGEPVGEAWGIAHERDAAGRSTGTILWTTPTGQKYRTEPELVMRSYRDEAAAAAA